MSLGIIGGFLVFLISYLKLHNYIEVEKLLFSLFWRGGLGFLLFFFAGFLLDKSILRSPELDRRDYKESPQVHLVDYRIPPTSGKEK